MIFPFAEACGTGGNPEIYKVTGILTATFFIAFERFPRAHPIAQLFHFGILESCSSKCFFQSKDK